MAGIKGPRWSKGAFCVVGVGGILKLTGALHDMKYSTEHSMSKSSLKFY